jgi:hypothetical protein
MIKRSSSRDVARVSATVQQQGNAKAHVTALVSMGNFVHDRVPFSDNEVRLVSLNLNLFDDMRSIANGTCSCFLISLASQDKQQQQRSKG